MKRHVLTASIVSLAILAVAIPVFALAVGDVEEVLALPGGQHPEGIAFDRNGNLYLGNRHDVLGGGFMSELRKITPDGTHDTVIATFAYSPVSALLGLVVDADGDVWAAVFGGADHGVWRIAGNGQHKERIAGSTAISFPNALTFDARGNLYVTDSGPVTGAIWRLAKGASQIECWSKDPALAPLPIDPIGFPLPGANGIVFYPSDSLYVANTEKGQIFRIPILADGSAGAAEAVTGFFAVPTVDGIAVDVHGTVYGVLPGHAVLGTPPVVAIDPHTGAVARATDAAYDTSFDIPLGIAFSTEPGERTNVYITNGDLPVAPVGNGASVVRANVGVKGFRGK